MKFNLNQKVFLNTKHDFTGTGGPLIPRGSICEVLRRRKSGVSCWVNVLHYGQREIDNKYLSAFSSDLPSA